MTFDEAVKIAMTNPGQGIREQSMSKGWKLVWLKTTRGDGALFCINPITGSNYHFTVTDAYRKSIKWGLA